MKILEKLTLKNFFLFSITGIVFLFFLVLLGLFSLVIIFVVSLSKNVSSVEGETQTQKLQTQFKSGNDQSQNKILSLWINGPIYTINSNNPLMEMLYDDNSIYGYDVKKTLEQAGQDLSIKGIIVNLNSPGGTIAGAQAISQAIKQYQKLTNNKVVAHIYDVAASGAYWVASACDYIVAENGSLVGNIGVIAGPFVYYDKVLEDGSGFVTQNGIEFTTVTAGEYKDIGNPFRKISPSELKILQDDIDFNYDLFINQVAENRQIENEKIKNEIKAMIYGSNQALGFNLIDEIGNFDQSLQKLLDLQNLDINDYQLMEVKNKDSFLQNLLSVKKNDTLQNQSKLPFAHGPLVLYGNYLVNFYQE